MITLSANLQKAFDLDAPNVILVNVGGLANGKFILGPRNLFGYFNNVIDITARSTSLDPVTMQQPLGSITVRFHDDGTLRALINANALIGKSLTFKIGADMGVQYDSGVVPFVQETDFGPFAKCVISSVQSASGEIRLQATDVRMVGQAQGSKIGVAFPKLVGLGSITGDYHGYSSAEAASMAIYDLFIAAGVQAADIDQNQFLVANNDAVRHLVVHRKRIPGDVTVPANSDRRVLDTSPVVSLADDIARVLNAYVRVQEDGIIGLKIYDPTAAISDRILQSDIIPGSFEMILDQQQVITSVIVKTLWENLHSKGMGFDLTWRDDATTEQTTWGWDANPKQSDLTIEDRWFGGVLTHAFLTAPDADITVAASYIDVAGLFAGIPSSGMAIYGSGSNVPGTVDATHPGYLWVQSVAGGSGDAGELIQYTTVTDVTPAGTPAGTIWRLGGLTRSMFNIGSGTQGTGVLHRSTNNNGGGQYIADVSHLPYITAAKLKRFKDSAPGIKFKVKIKKYALQLGDLISVEHPAYIAKGQDGLPAGNTVKFEINEKDVDWKSRIITIKAVFVNSNAHTATPTGVVGFPGVKIGKGSTNSPATDVGVLVSQTQTKGSLFGLGSFIGDAAATSASLTTTIPSQKVLHPDHGIVSVPPTVKAFTASKDTYVDVKVDKNGHALYVHTEVANNATAPAIPVGFLRVHRVVSSGSAITQVDDLRSTSMTFNGQIQSGQAMSANPPNSDGQPYTIIVAPDSTNYCTNPSFEINITDGWAQVVSGTSGTFSQDKSAGNFFFGAASLKMVGNVGATGQMRLQMDIPAVPGDVFSISGFAMQSASSDTIAIDWKFLDTPKTTTLASGVTSGIGTTPNQWLRDKENVLSAAPASTAWLRIQLRGPAANSNSVWWDGILVEKTSVPGPYFDGTFGSGYTWAGVAHNSTSARSGGWSVPGPPLPTSKSISGRDYGKYDVMGFQFAGGGSSFPSVAEAGDVFYRTDLGQMFRFSSSGWIAAIPTPPVGSIIGWTNYLANCPTYDVDVAGQYTGLPWHVCDGSVVADAQSPLNGDTLPLLNDATTPVFLGGYPTPNATLVNAKLLQHTHTFTGNALATHQHEISTSGTTGGTFSAVAANNRIDDNLGGFTRAISAGTPSGTNANAGTDTTNNHPKHQKVVWIIRIK